MELSKEMSSMKISMNDTVPSQHGKGFLNDLRASPSQQQQGVSGRPIRAGGESGINTGFPDVAAHSWNVNVPDFVPTFGSAGGGGGGGGGGSSSSSRSSGVNDGLLNPIFQLLNQSIQAQSRGDRDKCDQFINNCIVLLYSSGKQVTHELLGDIARFLIEFAKNNHSACDATATVLAFLALNFHVSENALPQLLQSKPSNLSRYPFYIALMRQCSEENETTRKAIMRTRTLTNEQSNYIQLFSFLYLYLPSVLAQSERQSALAKETLVYLRQLVDLHNCQLAYTTIHSVLMQVGVPLDVDCTDSAESIEQENAQLLTSVYEMLRSTIAAGNIGHTNTALDLIRLLELRAAGWNRNAGFGTDFTTGSLSATSVDSQNMTDDMYADYEQFLRESGQL